MKDLEERLDKVCDRYVKQRIEVIEILKERIRKFGPVHDEDGIVKTTFYGDGYFIAEVTGVFIDKNGTLWVETDEYNYDEHDDVFTHDTWLDISCAVIGNSTIQQP